MDTILKEAFPDKDGGSPRRPLLPSLCLPVYSLRRLPRAGSAFLMSPEAPLSHQNPCVSASAFLTLA